MSESNPKSGNGTSTEEKFARARQRVAMDVPVKTACKREGISRSRYYDLLAEEIAKEKATENGDLKSSRQGLRSDGQDEAIIADSARECSTSTLGLQHETTTHYN